MTSIVGSLSKEYLGILLQYFKSGSFCLMSYYVGFKPVFTLSCGEIQIKPSLEQSLAEGKYLNEGAAGMVEML